jgi:hypothetical protein
MSDKEDEYSWAADPKAKELGFSLIRYSYDSTYESHDEDDEGYYVHYDEVEPILNKLKELQDNVYWDPPEEYQEWCRKFLKITQKDKKHE